MNHAGERWIVHLHGGGLSAGRSSREDVRLGVAQMIAKDADAARRPVAGGEQEVGVQVAARLAGDGQAAPVYLRRKKRAFTVGDPNWLTVIQRMANTPGLSPAGGA
jgi:hypothetical protein